MLLLDNIPFPLSFFKFLSEHLTNFNNFLDIMLQSSPEDSSLKDVSPGESGIHDNFLLQNGM